MGPSMRNAPESRIFAAQDNMEIAQVRGKIGQS
jgi:hypothetical protein